MLRQLFIVSLSMFVMGTAAAQSQQAIRDQFFAETDTLKAAAEAAHAAVLAPDAYSDAMELYVRAGDTLARGRDLDRVREDLAEANGLFQRATEAAELAQVTFADALEARAAAMAAEAATYAARDWRRAEERMTSAARQLEDGNLNWATDTAADAMEDYREVEAEAINERARASAGGR